MILVQYKIRKQISRFFLKNLSVISNKNLLSFSYIKYNVHIDYMEDAYIVKKQEEDARMIQRERYIDKIKPFIGKDIIKVLTGIRRSGKSVMLRLIQEEIRSQGIADTQFISFNFESLENVEFCTADSLYQELKKRISSVQGKVYLFLDEIQEVEQWEKCINSVRVDFDCDIYITGSNAKLLSGELATYLGGR